MLTPVQIKRKWFESRRNSLLFFSLFFLPGVDAPQVYVRAWALGCFYSHISTRTFRRALIASVGSCTEIKSTCRFSGVTKCDRVWRKVPESDIGVFICLTLRASLSSTFLQILPDSVTPLKGHSSSPRSCPLTQSAPSKML